MSNEVEVLPAETQEEKQETKAPAIRKDVTDVVLNSWEDMQRMANAFSKSSLLPEHLRGPNKLPDILVIMQQAKELNIAPLQAVSGIHVIKGKPSISPELQLALIRSKAPEAFIKIEVDHDKVSVRCTMAPSKDRMDEAFVSVWDMERANKMGLANNDNYKKQPLTMLRWRSVGEAARTVFSHITKGLYNSEEIIDLLPPPVNAAPSAKELFGIKDQKQLEAKEGPSGVEVEK